MNRFNLRLSFDREGKMDVDRDAAFSDEYLRIHWLNMHPEPRIYKAGERVIILVGNPIARGKRDDKPVLAVIQSAEYEKVCPELNGSFLIIVYRRNTKSLTIINDRFASLAFFYLVSRSVLEGSFSLKQLYDELSRQDHAKIDPYSVYEFIALRRMLGERTLEKGCRYLTSAAIMRWGEGDDQPEIKKYWSPDFSVRAPKGRALVSDLSEKLKSATDMYMSDDQRFGLLLSGGLDSRGVLGMASKPLACFTTSMTRNNEYQVAHMVATAAEAEHHFIPRPPGVHNDFVDDAVFISSGMQIYSETQFMGYGGQILPYADVIFMALFPDIFYGGYYLPKRLATIFGRNALHYRLLPLQEDIAGQYLSSVIYRLRTFEPLTLLKEERRSEFSGYLRNSVEEILSRGRSLGADGYDLWEYLHFHNFSRHYSFLMMTSVRTFADCRCPAVENSLFDLAFSIPAQDKVNGTPYQDALTRLCPDLMRIRNANTNYPGGLSLPVQSALKTIQFAASRLLGTYYRPSSGWTERSWPSPAFSLGASPVIMDMVRSLPGSGRLDSLGFLDMNTIARVVDEHMNGTHDHAVLLNVLLTIDRFLLVQ